MKKRIWVILVGGALNGFIGAAAGIWANNPALIAIFSTAITLVTALVAFFGTESA